MGGNIHGLAQKLLNSFNLDNSRKFKAGQLCATPEQLEFYFKTFDAGPMLTRWLATGYEIQFTQVPTKFAREELYRQVKSGILSEVSYKPAVINPISCVFTNKWRLVLDCRLLNPNVVKWKTRLEDLSCVPARMTTLKKGIGIYI